MHIIILERIRDKSYLKSQFVLNDLENFRSDLVRISVLLNENLTWISNHILGSEFESRTFKWHSYYNKLSFEYKINGERQQKLMRIKIEQYFSGNYPCNISKLNRKINLFTSVYSFHHMKYNLEIFYWKKSIRIFRIRTAIFFKI